MPSTMYNRITIISSCFLALLFLQCSSSLRIPTLVDFKGVFVNDADTSDMIIIYEGSVLTKYLAEGRYVHIFKDADNLLKNSVGQWNYDSSPASETSDYSYGEGCVLLYFKKGQSSSINKFSNDTFASSMLLKVVGNKTIRMVPMNYPNGPTFTKK